MSQRRGPSGGTEAPQGKQAALPATGQKGEDPFQLETDSVELENGAEFSDATLDILRGYERPSYLQELEDSLDPIDDLDDHIAHGIKIPPATYEALQAAGKEEIEGLARMRDAPVDPEMQEVVRYRQQLAEGASPKDLNWLKMRAYYRGTERIRAEREAQKAQAEAQRMAQYSVPTDKIPEEALKLTAAQIAQRHKQQLALAAARARQARAAKQQSLTSDDLTELSEESEWPQQQLSQQLSPEIRDELSKQLTAYAARLAVQQTGGGIEGPSASPQGLLSTVGQETQAQQPQGACLPEKKKWRTVYTEAYLEQQRLSKKIRQQQQQRTLAFWLSLAAVSGTYLVRLLRRKKGKRGGKGAQQQPKAERSGKAAM